MVDFPRTLHALAIVAATVTAALTGEGEDTGVVPPDSGLPNIILTMADDLGQGDPGYMGNRDIETPHLDAMAAAALRFERFYAAAPVCSPTRGSALTGRHPYRFGVFSANVGHLRPSEVTLAEVLKRRGYATGHFGKWHLGTLTATVKESNRGGPRGAAHFAPPWEHDFDVCFSTEAKVPTWDPMLRPRQKSGNVWWDPVGDEADAVPYGTHYWTNGVRVTEDLRGDDSRLIMDRALRFIRDAAARKKPFLAVIWFHAPHLPVVSGPAYTERYARFDKHKQHYYGCITALDEQIGRLRRTLREVGAAANTLLWFCSDNGPEGNERAPGSTGGLRGRKRSLFEGGIRVPGLLEWPARIPRGRVTDVPASTSDYLPTVLDVIGALETHERALDGISLLPVIDGTMTRRPRPIAFQSGKQSALIGNRYKIIRGDGRRRGNNTRDDRYRLFDLVADPFETNDLAAKHPEIVERLAKELEAWQESCRRSLAGDPETDARRKADGGSPARD